MITQDSFTSNLFGAINNDDQQQKQQLQQQQSQQQQILSALQSQQEEKNDNQQNENKQMNATESSDLIEEKSFLFTRRIKLHNDYSSKNIRDSFKQLNVRELAEQYKQRNIKISNLSIPDYVEVVNESAASQVKPIHFLPPVFASQIENFSFLRNQNSRKQNTNDNGNDRDFSEVFQKKIRHNFLNGDEIKYINQNILDLLDHSQQTTRQNWKKYNKVLFNCQSNRKSRSTQVSPQRSRISSFSNQTAKIDIIRLQLEHNKNQFNFANEYNINQIKQAYNREIRHSLELKKKIDQLPPIKNYPSRGKVLENMMHMQMVKQIHSANGRELQEHLQDQKTQNNNNQQIASFKIQKNEIGFNLLKIQYKGFWLDTENKGWKPPSRETTRSAIIEQIGYCYGGIGMEVLNDFCAINLQTKDWTLLPMKGDYPKEGRHGHSLQAYKNQLILFGGEKKSSLQAKLKELINEVRIVNIEWRVLRCTGDWIEPRRDHASAIVGKNLIIHGGISQKLFCNDLFHLNLQFNRWQVAVCNNMSKIYPEGIAYHTACSVYFSERKNIQLYKPLEEKYSDKFNRLKEEGIYFFGGINQSGQTNNIFSILKTDTKPMQFIIPETLGQPPKSRFKHSMILQEQLEWIVIYGGINEDSGKDGFLKDMHMLKLDTLIWREITFYGTEKVGRCGHLCMSYGTQILVMGGLGEQGIFSMGASETELDQKTVLKLAQEEVRMVEQKSRKRFAVNSLAEKNAAGNISKIKQDLSQTEQAMELQIKIMESHKESVTRLLKKLQYKSQNSFLPVPNQMSDLNHMNSLLVYQNTTNSDEVKLKIKETINKEAEEFNKNDDSHNEILKQSFESQPKSIGKSSPTFSFKQKVQSLINNKKMTNQNYLKLNIDEDGKLNSSFAESDGNLDSPKSEKNLSGFLTPQYKKIKSEKNLSKQGEEQNNNILPFNKSQFSHRSRIKAQSSIISQMNA